MYACSLSMREELPMVVMIKAESLEHKPKLIEHSLEVKGTLVRPFNAQIKVRSKLILKWLGQLF